MLAEFIPTEKSMQVITGNADYPIRRDKYRWAWIQQIDLTKILSCH